MEELLELTLLYDFYGELLTEKQKRVYEMHYQEDLSFSEIGEELSITRQAVLDQIKRTEKILREYEQKLGLVSKFHTQQKALIEMKEILETLLRQSPERETQTALLQMRKIADDILA